MASSSKSASTSASASTALHDVAEISGFELDGKSSYNGDESKLLEDVVEEVLKLVPKPPLYVSIYPTGVEDKVKDLEERVLLHQHESGKAKVVGIVGLGGIGKTTLAKEFYNREKEEYRRSSFVSDVRENNSRGQLKNLQRQLIKELSGKDREINSTDEGIPLLEKLLPHWHALIILDDVDDIKQLRALLPVLPAKDSLILVTSRDKSILQIWELIEDPFIYTIEGLSLQHSVELFCWHAFHRPGPPDAVFEHLVNKFVDACGKLPLSLSVIGALLHGEKNPEHWEAQLRKIRETLPPEIQKILEISYESLDDEEKKIFLDVACFFVGKEKDTAMMIWEESGWAASLGLETLQNKHLVEVEVDKRWKDGQECMVECIGMHDHLRNMGRNLADKEPSLRRIWSVTENLSDLSPVGGIRDSTERDRRVTELRWRAPHRQGSSCVEGVFNFEQPPQLILLRCYNCPDSSFPPNISTKNLRVLHIEGSSLETLWHLESQAPLRLTELYVDAPLSEVPESIGNLEGLERIDLSGCSGLHMLPNSFRMLKNLRHLDLSKCSNLEMLPYSLGNLRNLQYINLSKCSNLQMLPNSLENLKQLQYMNLSWCSNFQTLPNSFGNLRNLRHIDLSWCSNLQMLPNSFGNLTNLQHINLSGCSNLPILPNSFGNLIQLKHLYLGKCYELSISKETLGQIRTLEALEISGCYGIEVLPPQITNQRFLREMYLFCPFLRELPSAIGELSHLEILHLESSCLELLKMGKSVSLEELQVRECVNLKSIQGLDQLTKLRRLDVANCSGLKELSGVEHLISLEKLNAAGCPNLQWGSGVLEQLDKLKVCIIK